MAERRRNTELTDRQREVAVMVARGLTNQEIANELGVSFHTVKRQLSNIMYKLNALNRADVAAKITRGEFRSDDESAGVG